MLMEVDPTDAGIFFAVRVMQTRIAMEKHEIASGRLSQNLRIHSEGVVAGLEIALGILQETGCVP